MIRLKMIFDQSYMFSTDVILSSSYSSYNRETVPVHMSNVECSGNEPRLIDCPHNSVGSGDGATLRCSYNNDGKCYIS